MQEGDACRDNSLKMNVMCKSIRVKFSSVQQLQTEELCELLQGGTSKVVLLDVRPSEEFDVSHLANSIQVDPKIVEAGELLEKIEKSCLTKENEDCTEKRVVDVVAYCSVGYRSSDLVTKLIRFTKQQQKEGVQSKTNIEMNFYNLEGSLFKWANEKRPMVDANNQPTQLCHPFDAIWGKILRKEYRASIKN